MLLLSAKAISKPAKPNRIQNTEIKSIEMGSLGGVEGSLIKKDEKTEVVSEVSPTPTPQETPQEAPKEAPKVIQLNTNGVEQWRPLVEKYFPATQVNNALAIMRCESGGNPTRHNYNPSTGDNSWGLYQINLYGANAKNRPPAEQLINGEFNIQYAAQMYSWMGRFGSTGGWYNCSRNNGIY